MVAVPKRRFEIRGPEAFQLPPEAAAAIAEESSSFVRRVLDAQIGACEAACRDLAALGYTVADLRAVHHPAPGRMALIVIQVRGRDVIEIVTEFKVLAVVVTSKVIAWPPPVDPIAAQVARAADGE